MTKEIELTRGYVALVDDEDHDKVSKFKWTAQVKANTVYAYRTIKRADGSQTAQLLHRFLLEPPDGLMVDHKDGSGLNNCRSNLRLATNAENGRNRRKNVNNKSGYKGVSWRKQRSKWKSQINVNGRNKFLGYFTDVLDGARAYDRAALELHGEYASLNFPQEVAA